MSFMPNSAMARLLAILLMVLMALCVRAEQLVLTLDDAVAIARVKSVDAAVALDRLRSAYRQWRIWRADRLPEVVLQATLPSYADQYSPYMDSDGRYSFVRNRALQLNAALAVKQNIRLTGATLQLSTSLDFLRQFGGLGNRYMALPVALSLTQPLFAVNTMRWDSRIEPVRYTEAKAEFLSATEDVAQKAITYYFNLLLSRENHEIARQNYENALRLRDVAVEKRRMGQISLNDLRQMELNLLEARSDLTDCASNMKADMFGLRTFLDIENDSVEIVPVVPAATPAATVSYPDALEHARANNKLCHNMLRRQLEADYAVAQAKGDMRKVNLFVQVGYTGASDRVSEAYSRLRGNQVVQVGIEIPLFDGGKRRERVRVAESNRRVQESTLRKESMEFDQNLFILVERFGNQQRQFAIAAEACDIATARYNTNVETYLTGRISTLDLNDSQVKKDESRRLYINQLYRCWLYWYQLRAITLYDFEHRTDINADIEKLVNMKTVY